MTDTQRLDWLMDAILCAAASSSILSHIDIEEEDLASRNHEEAYTLFRRAIDKAIKENR